jgi:hypothetical protein
MQSRANSETDEINGIRNHTDGISFRRGIPVGRLKLNGLIYFQILIVYAQSLKALAIQSVIVSSFPSSR